LSLLALHFSEYTCRLALALAEEHDVQLLLSTQYALRELTPTLKAEVERRVEVHFHPRPDRRLMFAHGLKLARQIAGHHADVIHAQEAGSWTVAVAALLSWRLRQRFVLTVHDPEPHAGHDEGARARNSLAIEWLRRYADAILVHGPSMVPNIERLEPRKAGRVFTVNHGVLGEFTQWDDANDSNSFLFFGRVETYKGLEVLLDAADLLNGQGVGFRIRIAGAGDDLERHRSRIAAATNITLEEGFVPSTEVPTLFAEATAVVVPYLEASQSGVLAHAFAAHKPIIVTSVGAFPDIVQDEVNGLLVPPRDAAALAEAMKRITNDAGLRAKLIAGAARAADGELSWRRIATETSEIYRRILKKDRAWPPWVASCRQRDVSPPVRGSNTPIELERTRFSDRGRHGKWASHFDRRPPEI
jgi:glycosyltransferase involved in cell wall biosynthesis